jgi:DNA-binding NarL/FixJ family response regulator
MPQVGNQARPIDQRLRILIAEDHPLIRKQVRSILGHYHDRFDLCGEAQDGAEAIAKAQDLKPDVVVLNLSMPVLNGLEAARKIKSDLPGAAIVILSSNTDKYFVAEAKKAGARGFVAKSRAAHALVEAIEAAVIGRDFVLVD